MYDIRILDKHFDRTLNHKCVRIENDYFDGNIITPVGKKTCKDYPTFREILMGAKDDRDFIISAPFTRPDGYARVLHPTIGYWWDHLMYYDVDAATAPEMVKHAVETVKVLDAFVRDIYPGYCLLVSEDADIDREQMQSYYRLHDYKYYYDSGPFYIDLDDPLFDKE